MITKFWTKIDHTKMNQTNKPMVRPTTINNDSLQEYVVNSTIIKV